MQRDLVVPSNDEHGWDWTDPAERAAVAAAKEAAEAQAAGLAASGGGAAAAGDGGGDSGGGGGGGTQVDVGDEPQKEAAAGAAGSAPGEGYVPSGGAWAPREGDAPRGCLTSSHALLRAPHACAGRIRPHCMARPGTRTQAWTLCGHMRRWRGWRAQRSAGNQEATAAAKPEPESDGV